MNYYELEEEKDQAKREEEKQKKIKMLLIPLLLLGAGGFYLWNWLNETKEETRKEILEQLQISPVVSVDIFPDEVKEIWWFEGSWDKYLDGLYLPQQINDFKKGMLKSIQEKREELKDEPRKKRQEEIKNAREFLESEEKSSLEIQNLLKELETRINNTPINDLSSASESFMQIILQKRARRKRLYWSLPAYNWADRWLVRNAESFNGIWQKFTDANGGKELSYFNAKAIYKISFPSSLWENLTEEQKQTALLNGHGELKIKEEARNYHFTPLIEEWRNRVVDNPTRGEYKPNENILDNNALFYGAPRTGKSIIAELITDEADKVPLVTIQGSTLTPNQMQKEFSIDPLLKFIFTVACISHDLADNYGFQRSEDGEVSHILFLDEADQICTNNLQPPRDASTQLTFLKECMGSDNKSEESKNLWIAATNHLDNINVAIYQSGRLSNPLDFSWTLAVFNDYAGDAGITDKFPEHWLEETTLNPEDNQWVNKFNKIIFDKDFLPFWQKFINNSDTQTALKQEVEWKDNPATDQPEKIIKKKGIQLGEFFELFWQLYDSKQLEAFNGKWRKPRKPKIEEIVEETLKLAANKISEDISKTLDERLKELNQTSKDTKNVIDNTNNNLNNTITRFINKIDTLLTAIGRNT